MNYLLTFIVFGVLFALMAIGLIVAKKTLRKGCSDNPDDCACLTEGKDPNECDK